MYTGTGSPAWPHVSPARGGCFMQALLIVIVTCHVSCVTVTACHTLAWVGEVPPVTDDLS